MEKIARSLGTPVAGSDWKSALAVRRPTGVEGGVEGVELKRVEGVELKRVEGVRDI
jgi:hypothetical protein